MDTLLSRPFSQQLELSTAPHPQKPAGGPIGHDSRQMRQTLASDGQAPKLFKLLGNNQYKDATKCVMGGNAIFQRQKATDAMASLPSGHSGQMSSQLSAFAITPQIAITRISNKLCSLYTRTLRDPSIGENASIVPRVSKAVSPPLRESTLHIIAQ